MTVGHSARKKTKTSRYDGATPRKFLEKNAAKLGKTKNSGFSMQNPKKKKKNYFFLRGSPHPPTRPPVRPSARPPGTSSCTWSRSTLIRIPLYDGVRYAPLQAAVRHEGRCAAFGGCAAKAAARPSLAQLVEKVLFRMTVGPSARKKTKTSRYDGATPRKFLEKNAAKLDK